MIHYHGTPITPKASMVELAGRSFCVPWPDHRDVEISHQIGEGVMLDNGAFSLWTAARKRGKTSAEQDWTGFYAWVEPWLAYQTTWAVIPDVIDGDARANDRLLEEWPYSHRGAPVWHMHEPIERLLRLASDWPRVCLGSSAEFSRVGSSLWHERMSKAMDALCGNGPAPVWLHMLRGLSLCGSVYPFASADSTNIAANHNGNNTRGQKPQSVRAMADRIDAVQCPALWTRTEPENYAAEIAARMISNSSLRSTF